MITPAIPQNEKERLQALEDYEILDTLPEQDFDDLTQIAADICNTPISLVSLIDTNRQWFKSRHGLDAPETPRDVSFCGHSINRPDEVLIVPDSREDERFFDNPLVTGDPHVIFYAGVPLINPQGHSLGTLCVIDSVPKTLNSEQVSTLKALARQVVGQLELRKKIRELEAANKEASRLNKNLSEFAYRLSHDLKTPIRGINTLSYWLKKDYGMHLNEEGQQYLDLLGNRSIHIQNLINGVLEYSSITTEKINKYESFDLTNLIMEVISQSSVPTHVAISYPQNHEKIKQYRQGLFRIFKHLLSNAIKHNHRDEVAIQINFEELDQHYLFSVEDNGPGIADKYRDKVFQLFETLDKENGIGIGLASSRLLVEKMGGEINLTDRPGGKPGLCVRFTVRKG